MSLLSKEPLADRNLPTDTAASGLPNYYYFSQEIFALERRSLWDKVWQWVGRESQVAHPGDYFTCTLGDQPMLVIRADDGTLRSLHNVCPHRGARMLDGQGHCNRIICPYHGWNFDREGNLKGLPRAECFPTLDQSNTRLIEGRVDTWGGFIFVHPESQGESLQDYLAGFPAYLEQYEQPWKALREVDHWFYEEPANWKFPIENYLECYHLPVVHAQSLRCFDPSGIQYTPSGRHYQISVPWTAEDSVAIHPSFPGKPKHKSYQGFIFPNLMVNTARDMVSVFKLTPLTPETTQFEVFIYQTEAQVEAFPYDKAAFRLEFDRVLNEDFMAVRSLQMGVHSKAYRVQLAEELEFGITHFHQALLGYLPRPPFQATTLTD
ncbi:MAG: aromatic ring-hydroxylating dioxygenase subunit alpha [Trichocoleus desertorum ATA4-8-CV12]|jgi:phenylpropionate dioxygenase-like ring-hydroxylating dioxygenase large terminal subunit|nr:aromatic ring-hydroxylating dioxygenase subunit alpha [Trichocoleus desertorum ATA4-8-CV12]